MLAERLHDRTRVVLFNNPLNPTGSVVSARRISPCSPVSASGSTPSRSATRSGSTWCSTGAAHLDARRARHARAQREDRLGRQDLLAHRLEGRLRLRGAGAHAGAGQGAPVPHLHHAAQPAGGRRLRAGQGRRLFRRHARRPAAQPRPLRRRPAAPAASACCRAQGTYFLNVDLAPLGETDDVAFCRRLVREHGVAAIPVSAFYAEDAVRTVVRFCFAKRDATL